MFDLYSGAMIIASDDGKLPTDQFLPSVVSKLTDAAGNWRFPLLSDRQAGATPRRLIDMHYRNFGPRFGFVRQLDYAGTTVVRGGYGIFYTRYPIQYLLQTIGVNPPFAGLFNHSQAIAKRRAGADPRCAVLSRRKRISVARRHRTKFLAAVQPAVESHYRTGHRLEHGGQSRLCRQQGHAPVPVDQR
jgi:hypothetical protein